MKITAQKEITYILKLTEEEARWLKAQAQNAASPLDQEPLNIREIRMRFWKTLEDVEL